MSTKQSQLFMYFQNKAHHYHNIALARSKVADKLDSSMNQTIANISDQKYNRDMPLNKRYQIQLENAHMTHRLASIDHTARKEVSVNGDYSRYHSFERKFRQKNWFQDQVERLRDLKNQKIKEKIKCIKPQVGSLRSWEVSYQENTKLAKSKKSFKGDLHVDRKSLPQAYLQFINRINRSGSDKSLQDVASSRSSKAEGSITIDKQRIFVLPNLTAKKAAKLRNSQVSVASAEPVISPEQAKAAK